MFDLATNPRVFRDWKHCVAFGLGSGLARLAPGTWGTLVAIPFWLLLVQLPPWLYAVTVVAAFALGSWVCDAVSRDLGVHDHGGIVFDEFVGYWITMFLVPPTVAGVVAGFVAFRVFDIWKPWPIRWFDRNVHGGFGVMFDDVVAGLVAWCAVQAVLRLAG
ncbi:MAG: phosphatidylglycerophosphatase A [Steroidobacteraceae bacterium]